MCARAHPHARARLVPFIHSSVDGHFCCFHLFAVVNNAAMNLGLQFSVEDPAFNFFMYMPRSGIAGSHGKCTFDFLGAATLFSTVAAPSHIPTDSS